LRGGLPSLAYLLIHWIFGVVEAGTAANHASHKEAEQFVVHTLFRACLVPSSCVSAAFAMSLRAI
jgi:hypothetical protein